VSSFAQRFTEQGLEQGLQRGRQQGLQQGRREGLQEGEAAMLSRQLERRFGADVLARYRARIEAADAETLLVWSERILDADAPEEIFEAEGPSRGC
jgi:flagellar biosynthesis/type III secretory pathway protein FliH